MVSYSGYEEIIKKVYDYGHEAIFEFWDDLNDLEKKAFLDEISGIDFKLLKKLYKESNAHSIDMDFNPAPYIPLPETDKDRIEYSRAKEIGIEHIKQGKVAAFIVAGGQGSRLGFDGPKGKYPVGPISGKTLFHIHAEKILKYSGKYDVSVPWFIMTSELNHEETVQYFEENKIFGLDKSEVIIFRQNMIPSLDSKGRLILDSKNSLFKNPDGHGGSLTALYTSGSLELMKERGIETISYFQVDNPLVRIVDPVFIGFQIQNVAEVSSKALKKAYAEEKVGVFVEFSDKRIGVVEYTDMSDEKTNMKDENGNLKFSSGSIAIHLFNREFLERITSGRDISLPFHTAKKKIKSFHRSGSKEIEGFKFEKFVFDALLLTDKNIVFETLREEEFAPVKNASGVDSVESAQKLMIDLNIKWLKEKGITVPENTKIVEISPIIAVEPEDLDEAIKIPDKENVYLE